MQDEGFCYVVVSWGGGWGGAGQVLSFCYVRVLLGGGDRRLFSSFFAVV